MNDQPARWRKDAPWTPIPPGCGRGRLPEPPVPTIDNLVSVFGRHLYVPDPEPVHVLASAVAANMLDGDPLWVMVVAPSSWGKTELIAPFVHTGYCHLLDDVSQAGLLSGGVRRRDGTSTGGLLAEFENYGGVPSGIIVIKDLSSVMASLDREDSGVMGALRRVFDGEYVRRLGTNGGETFAWRGKAGLIAGVTEVVDFKMDLLDQMGSRFTFYRLADPADRDGAAWAVHERGPDVRAVRAELAGAVRAFFGLRPPRQHCGAPDPTTADRLVRLAGFVSVARSGVYRDARGEVEAVPREEGSARLLGELEQLYKGGLAVGLADPWPMVAKVAFDSLARDKLRSLVEVARRHRASTANIADNLGLPKARTGRHLDDLAAHGVIVRSTGSAGGDVWELSTWAAERWHELAPKAPDDVGLTAVGDPDVSTVPGDVEDDLEAEIDRLRQWD